MKNKPGPGYFIPTSVCRISDLDQNPFDVKKIDQSYWATGDYVVVEVLYQGSEEMRIELCNGRMMEVMKRDQLIGALGIRHATLEATGTWKEVRDDGYMHVLTGAGLFGKMTSRSSYLGQLIRIKYSGHVLRNGLKCTMESFVKPVEVRKFETPVILMVGTSMSAGKTTAARIITRQMKRAGKRVVAAKLTGAGRLRDILSVKDAGADNIFDFVDVGLPSSIVPITEYKKALEQLLSRMAGTESEIAVIEIGASPLEPYNGTTAINRIKHLVKATVLCASDPYSVLGVMKSFKLKPSLVTGIATNTLAGMELIEKLCHVRAINIKDHESLPILRKVLNERLGNTLEFN